MTGAWKKRERSGLVVLIVENVLFREHTLMQDAGNEDASTLLPVEQGLFAMLMTAQARANVITDAAAKNVAFGDTAGVTLSNSRSQRDNLCFVLLLLTLEGPQPGAHDFAGVFVAPALEFFGDEVVTLVG